MARQYNSLAITALRSDPGHPLTRPYQLMRFPGRWKHPLRELARAQTRRTTATVSIPVQALNEAITTLVPDCVVTMTYAAHGGEDQDWLLADEPIDPTALFAIVAAWVRSQKASPELIAATLGQMEAAHLTWNRVHLDLTAPADQHAMRLLPLHAAAALSRPGTVSPHHQLRFLRCPIDTGAELISWPPEGGEGKTPFSVKISITAQTLPTSSEIFLNLAFGVRRWMPRSALMGTDRHSVYLLSALPYINGTTNSRHFGRAYLKHSRARAGDGTSTYAPRWDDAFADVLAQAGCLARLPDPQQLLDKPMDYLRDADTAAALVYKTGMLTNEKVSAGLSVTDREPLMTWAAGQLAPHLRQVNPLPREKTKIHRQLTTLRDIDTSPFVPEYLHSVVGPRLTIDLLTDTDPPLAYALERIGSRLNIPVPTVEDLREKQVVLDAGPVSIELRHRSVPHLRADLDRSGGVSVLQTVEERRALIPAALPATTNPTVTLVELSGLKAYQKRRAADPKFAIRLGLLDSGRLSQFVTPMDPDSGSSDGADTGQQERCNAAVDDLFRQLGLRPTPLPALSTASVMGRPPALLGVWMIRKNQTRDVWKKVAQQVPVALLIDPTGQHVQVCAPAVSWQPLHTGLLGIGRRYADVPERLNADDALRFIHAAVRSASSAYPDTLLVTHAQNLRSIWSSLSNARLRLDELTFGDSGSLMTGFPGLRHVRVRGAEGGETPQAYGIDGDEIGQPSGLWNYHFDRVYGSVSAKPVTSSGALKGVSKLVPTEHKGALQSPKPRAKVWNPQFIEILVAGLQPQDRPAEWAALTHDLRSAAPYVRDTTILPWPLHLARQIEEYLSATGGVRLSMSIES